MATFFYDGQIRRFILQFVRALSHFEVEYGKDETGNKALVRVPVRYGEGSRMVNAILRNNSESALNTVPMISCYISDMEYARDRVQEPNFVSKINVRQRRYDAETGNYTTQQGNAYTIERLMPVPYDMTMKADIWTANLEQKHQLFEQITAIFNPSIEVQSTDNYVDWTSLSVIELTNVVWTSRSVPSGAEELPDILTFTFKVPVWISAPAKVKKLGVVQKIISSVYDVGGDLSIESYDQGLLMGERVAVTPFNYGVLLVNNQLQLLKYNEIVDNSALDKVPRKVSTVKLPWAPLLNMYGEMRNGISQFRLQSEDGLSEIVGTIAYHPTDPSILLFTPDPDTFPSNDLLPITAIIDPIRSGPNSGLPAPTTGTRYLILEDIGAAGNVDGADAWKSTSGQDFVARANDIVEWDGLAWNVMFDSTADSSVHYVTNLNTNTQYKWTGSTWVKSVDGEYPALQWTIVI